MTAKNDITGDALVSKISAGAYRDNWDTIFGKKPPCARIRGGGGRGSCRERRHLFTK